MEFILGFLIASVISITSANSYKNLLVNKARDRGAEFIKGEFYYVVKEAEYIKLKKRGN